MSIWAARHGSFAISVGVIVLMIVVWELACRLGNVPGWLLPAPSKIAVSIWEHRAMLPGHCLSTLTATVSGFVLAVAFGVPLAIAITASRVARNVLYPVFLVFQSVPKIALAPLILLWAGYGLPSKILVASVTAFFPIVINTAAGMSAISEEMLQLTRAYNTPALRVFLKVKLPFAMPYLFSGMKVAMTLAVIGAVVGEFVGSDTGLGFVILTSSSTMNTSLVFSAMILLSAMGIGLFYLIALVERLACPWYGQAEPGDTTGGTVRPRVPEPLDHAA
jgi:NitT/TauT family transport system permease protein